MWKAHRTVGKMRYRTILNLELTLTFGIFLVNCNTFPELPQILSKLFLIFNSTLSVNYANQALFERT